jgi:hypothetical protein
MIEYKKTATIFNSLIWLSLLLSAPSYAVNSLPSGTTGAAGILSLMPSNSTSNISTNPIGKIYVETHSVTDSNANPYTPGSSCPGNPINYYCSQGGAVVGGSYVNSSGNNCSYTYSCYVALTPSQISYNSNIQSELNAGSTTGGWVTVPNTSDSKGATQTDLATLQYPNGYPQTTFMTRADFGYGSGGIELNFAQVNFSINSGAVATGNSQSNGTWVNNFYTSASVTATVAPNSTVSIWKNVKGAGDGSLDGWNSTCQSTFTMPAQYIGQTVYVDCCPFGSNTVNYVPDAYTSKSQQWGGSGNLASLTFYSNTNTSVNCGSTIGGGGGDVNASNQAFIH